ncbi:hypothetical protein [Streptomyces sp. NPDC007088]|uniref:hypothetical protein n=1 Tax=Streptomyces sp. NPDC007088 TaxID=3364773 RepID=UPI00368AF993
MPDPLPVQQPRRKGADQGSRHHLAGADTDVAPAHRPVPSITPFLEPDLPPAVEDDYDETA